MYTLSLVQPNWPFYNMVQMNHNTKDNITKITTAVTIKGKKHVKHMY